VKMVEAWRVVCPYREYDLLDRGFPGRNLLQVQALRYRIANTVYLRI